MRSINITNIHITCFDNYPAFNEIMDSVEFITNKHGFSTSRKNFCLKKDAINIIFAGHKLHASQIPSDIQAVIYNLEQVAATSPWLRQNYIEVLQNSYVWDYNEVNIQQLQDAGVNNVSFIPLGYTPNLECVKHRPDAEKDIDVLFYGLINDYRQQILTEIASKGLHVVCNAQGVSFSTTDRNDLIARAKVVVNIPYYQDSIFEIARVSYLMSNKCCVVSQIFDSNVDPLILEGIAKSNDANNIADLCSYYVKNIDKRKNLAEVAYKNIQKINMEQAVVDNLNKIIQNQASKTEKNKISLPKNLQIGSGKSWKYDYFNLDIIPSAKPDFIFNLNDDFPFDKNIDTWRFGNTKITKGYFKYILSEHVFEHLQDIIKAMTTCLDLLEDGGILEIETPYDLSLGAWQDPTHLRGLNENSWLYYTEWYWYIGWTTHRFDMIGHSFGINNFGQNLMQKYQDFELVKNYPRTIDTFRVKLQKRPVTEQERIKNSLLLPDQDNKKLVEVEYI